MRQVSPGRPSSVDSLKGGFLFAEEVYGKVSVPSVVQVMQIIQQSVLNT